MNYARKNNVSLLTTHFLLCEQTVLTYPLNPLLEKGDLVLLRRKKRNQQALKQKKCFVSKQYFCRGNRDNRNSGGGYGVLRKHLAHPNASNTSNTVAPQPQNVTHSKRAVQRTTLSLSSKSLIMRLFLTRSPRHFARLLG